MKSFVKGWHLSSGQFGSTKLLRIQASKKTLHVGPLKNPTIKQKHFGSDRVGSVLARFEAEWCPRAGSGHLRAGGRRGVPLRCQRGEPERPGAPGAGRAGELGGGEWRGGVFGRGGGVGCLFWFHDCFLSSSFFLGGAGVGCWFWFDDFFLWGWEGGLVACLVVY